MEIFGNKAILTIERTPCETADDLFDSDVFKKLLTIYIDRLAKKHSMLLDIFGKEETSIISRIKELFTSGRKTPGIAASIAVKRVITSEQLILLSDTIRFLAKLKSENVPGVVKGAALLLENRALFLDFINGLYYFWLSYDRFTIYGTDGPDGKIRPRTIIQDTVERLDNLVKNTYRDIKDNLSEEDTRVYRQTRAGVDITAITGKYAGIMNFGPYRMFDDVPLIRQIILAPPLILNPSMNKRTGSFEKVDKNPFELFNINRDDWICYPAKAGPLLIFVFFHKVFIDLGMSLCNLFELADEEDLKRKPDAVFAYGVEGASLDGLGAFPTVFFEDDENGLLAAAIPGRGEFGYFGYLKKMILTLHNIKAMKTGRLPFHGAFVRIILKGGKEANLLLIGDSGAGKSETLEAFTQIGDEYIQDIIIIADDMGSIEKGPKKSLLAYGTETGAFLRLDDLQPGYAFGRLDAAIIMSAAKTNARIILPVTTYKTIMAGHKIDYVLYANNYEEPGEGKPVLEKFKTPEEALAVFREGKVMSKGTTSSTGLNGNYFANIFGPPQYMELHEEISQDYFKEFFARGVFVGQLRTRLGIEGWERKGPDASARELLEMILSG